ncbi:MAG: hypothetical protein NVS9B8_15420 [Candidatus Limnocylindrales bacterium]
MDSHVVIPFPANADAQADSDERAVVEIDAAILLVASGAARRVLLAALPLVDRVAAIGAAHAGAAGVSFRVEATGPAGHSTTIVGPRR